MLKRLAVSNPDNPFERERVRYDPGVAGEVGLELFEDDSRQVLSKNTSPDLGFAYSVNAYRGCAHGCAYCYARRSHEYWGLGSGTDFERKLIVKPNAPELLRKAFEGPAWRGERIVFSSNTDAYQPLEARLRLTRGCLEVCAEYRNPVHIITKGSLVERDLDLLLQLHQEASAAVSVSVPFWDAEAARALEPYAPSPQRRMETVRRLAEAELPVVVHLAPVIPGLTDRDVIPLLEAVAAAGGRRATLGALRLPGSVAEVFEQRLRGALPLRADRVLARVREMRGGALNDSRFGARMAGRGSYFAAIQQAFQASCRRLELSTEPAPHRGGTFRRPPRSGAQLALF